MQERFVYFRQLPCFHIVRFLTLSTAIDTPTKIRKSNPSPDTMTTVKPLLPAELESLKGRTLVVTGGASGMGKQVSLLAHGKQESIMLKIRKLTWLSRGWSQYSRFGCG